MTQRRFPMARIASAIKACIGKGDDLRSPAAHAAFAEILQRRQRGIVLSVGGGPTRPDPRMTNMNIAWVENVDVVATAYRLPFKDNSVAAVHCEAVLEHLEFPENAVAEMFRVLQFGGVAFGATPFLQPYHGYPDHFQNFTLQGHVRLFERVGFSVVDAGTCVGPTFALVDIAANYARELFPTRIASRVSERLIRFFGRPLRLLDIPATAGPRSSMLCSSTFVYARKAG
jgi:SAM-dependent methyltransferase